MKPLFQKEWREHFKLALAGLAILTLMLVFVVRDGLSQLEKDLTQDQAGGLQADHLQPLLYDTVLVDAGFFCAIFGFVLGWLQMQAEKHPDLRAFLLHRPVTRTAILWGKWLSGVALYCLGAGVPLAGLVIYAVIPGDVPAPFEWAMVLPLANVFLLGLVFYEAGLLTGLRQARWYGSRIFGLGMAFIAVLGVTTLPDFGTAFTSIVFAGLTLAVTVWGGMQTGGYYRNQPWPGKLALSITCAVAGMLLCGLAAILLAVTLPRAHWEPSPYYQFTRAGMIYQVTFEPAKITDLNGRPLLDEKTGTNMTLDDFSKLSPWSISTYVDYDRHPNRRDQWNNYSSSLHFYIPWRQAGKTLWYLTRDGRLTGYDGLTRRKIGILTPGDGSGQPAMPDRLFNWPPVHYSNNANSSFDNQPWALVAGGTLYSADMTSHQVKPLLITTNEDGIGGYQPDADSHKLLVVTRKFIRLLNLTGGTELQVPAEPGWPEYSVFNVLWLEPINQFAVQFDPNIWVDTPSAEKQPIQIEWVKADGEILRRQKLPPLPESKMVRGSPAYGTMFVPPAVRVGLEYYSSKAHTYDKWDVLSLVPAMFCALIGWGVGRRYHFTLREQAGWAGFHLLFGLPGLLAFFSVQEWPARERCPQCRQLRMVNREQCEHCGGEFAPPARNGTEIFEPAAVAERMVAG